MYESNTELDNGFDAYKPYTSVCTNCAHFDRIELKCTAYPNGIPNIYLSGEQKHDKVQENQVGNDVFTLET